jgi:hypothetical protein
LRVLGFFKRFAEAELWEVVRIGQWQRVAAGTEIAGEGEPGDFFCVLLEGEARVTKNRKLLSVLGPGECFGEMAYLSAERHERGATVTASKNAHIVRVPTSERASVGCRAHFDGPSWHPRRAAQPRQHPADVSLRRQVIAMQFTRACC